MRKILGWLMAGLLALAPLSASAAILWAGGEDISVNTIGTLFNTTNGASGGYYTAFSRVALQVQNGTSTADPPTNRIQTPTFTASSSLWIHAVFQAGSSVTTTNNAQGLLIRSPDGVGRVYLRQTGTSGTLKLSIANAARSFTDLVTLTGTFAANTLYTLDMQVPYTCGGGDVTNIYLNSVLAGTYTGSLCTDSATTLNQVEFMQLNNAASGAGNCENSNSAPSCWSQMIVASEDTRSMSLATLTLQGAGATQAWTPNTLANVNKPVINDASFVSTSSNNQISEWTAPTSAPTGTWGVKSLILNARLLISTTGPQNAEFIAHVSGSDYTSLCTNPTLTTGFANYYCQINNSPATSMVWGISEIYNSGGNQLNYGVESLM